MSNKIQFDIEIEIPIVKKELVARFIAMQFETLQAIPVTNKSDRYSVGMGLIGSFTALASLGFINAKDYHKLIDTLKKIEGEVLPS